MEETLYHFCYSHNKNDSDGIKFNPDCWLYTIFIKQTLKSYFTREELASEVKWRIFRNATYNNEDAVNLNDFDDTTKENILLLEATYTNLQASPKSSEQ